MRMCQGVFAGMSRKTEKAVIFWIKYLICLKINVKQKIIK